MCRHVSLTTTAASDLRLKSVSRALQTRTVTDSGDVAAPLSWETSACAILASTLQTDAATTPTDASNGPQLPTRAEVQHCIDEIGISVHDSGMMDQVRALRLFPDVEDPHCEFEAHI